MPMRYLLFMICVSQQRSEFVAMDTKRALANWTVDEVNALTYAVSKQSPFDAPAISDYIPTRNVVQVAVVLASLAREANSCCPDRSRELICLAKSVHPIPFPNSRRNKVNKLTKMHGRTVTHFTSAQVLAMKRFPSLVDARALVRFFWKQSHRLEDPRDLVLYLEQHLRMFVRGYVAQLQYTGRVSIYKSTIRKLIKLNKHSRRRIYKTSL